MSALPFAYAWRWKGGVTWKLTLTKNPNAHRDLEIKELFDHSDFATVIERQAVIDRLLDAAWRAGRDAAAEAAGSYDPVAAMVGYELEPPSDLRAVLEVKP